MFLPRSLPGALLHIASLFSLLLFSPHIHAAVFCVDSPTSLDQAIAAIGQDGDQADEVRVVSGDYEASKVNMVMAGDTPNDLIMSGGWAPGCTIKASNDVRDTRIVGATDKTLSLTGLRRVELSHLTLFKFALVRTRRNGDQGGYPIRWDAMRLSSVSAVEVLSEPAGVIDIRNIQISDSGQIGGDCMMSIVQETDDGYSYTTLTQSTFALNKGAKQVCLQGAESNKLVQNNIFDGADLQNSVFVSTTPATLQMNRIQSLGGLAASADSIDNFNTAPGFVDLAARNFELAPGSPAINRGYMVLREGQGRFDLYGKTRWTGMRPDAGALESGTIESSQFLVTNRNDSGAGSLRQAVLDANASPDASIIQFDVADACAQRFILNSELPVIAAPLFVDGYSQSGSEPNSGDSQFNAVICVGIIAGQSEIPHAFRVSAPSASLRIEGMAFAGFGSSSGASAAVLLNGARGSIVRGSLFGGSSPFGALAANSVDVSVSGTSLDIQVGGPQVYERNLFGHTVGGANIGIGQITRNTQLLGNWFGLDRDGVTGINNSVSVYLEGSDALIRNNLVASVNTGILLSSLFAQHNLIQQNEFGRNGLGNPAPVSTAISARGGMGNTFGAIANHAPGGNRIHNSSGPAIDVFTTGSTPLAMRIRANEIRNSGTGMSIDLGGQGPTANDPGDVDEGPNRLINHPLLASVTDLASTLIATGSVDTMPGPILIDLYGSNRPGGVRGEAAVHLAQLGTIDGSFLFQMPVTVDFPYAYLSVTATDADGNTSELSPAMRAPSVFVDSFE